ncbi:MAG: VOC family protein [Bacteroidota bacterium]
MSNQLQPFHLAFPILDIEDTRTFYRDVLNCEIGRESERWIDFNFFGHQLSAHKVEKMPDVPHNEVDGKQVPVTHFGIILEGTVWEALHQRLKTLNVPFIIEPYLRFAGEIGEQGTFFILDPAGNGLEFKTFKSEEMIFQK